MSPHVAVDAGRSRCRARLVTGPPVSEVASPATLVDPDGAQLLAAGIAEAISMLPARPAGTLSVAAAGALTRPEAAAVLADLLADSWPGPVLVTSDVVAAHACALAGRPGVVLVAGTGATAFAVDAEGGCALVDGGGYLAGDAGSGFTIGRAGLTAALRHVDGRPGGSARLAAAAQARFAPQTGTPDGASLRRALAIVHGAGDPVRQVASFATEVAAVARAGDPVGQQIWHTAAVELATTATAALRGQTTTEIALVGALFDADDLLTTPLRKEIADKFPYVTVRVVAADVLSGAAWLADQPAGAYEPLMTRSGPLRAGEEESAHLEEGR